MAQPPPDHISDADLQSYLDGRTPAAGPLDPARTEEIDAHLRECEACGARLDRFREADRDLRRLAVSGEAPVRGIACPDDATLVAKIGEPAPSDLWLHVQDCPWCAARARAALDEEAPPADGPLITAQPGWQLEMGRKLARIRRRRRWRVYAAGGIAAAAVLAFVVVRLTLRPAAETLLARAYTERRPFEFRLPDAGYSAWTPAKGPAGSFRDESEALQEARLRLRREYERAPHSPQTKMLLGHAELLSGHYGAAIELLTEAQAEGEDALLLLAGAHYLEARNRPPEAAREYSRALDLLEQLLRRKPDDARVLFNLALVQEKLNAQDARNSWKRYLELDRHSGYRSEAEAHLAELNRILGSRTRILDAVGGGPEAYLALAPGEADANFELFLDAALAGWLPALRPGSAAERAIALLAGSLRRRAGDAFLSDVANGPAEARARLASAVRLVRSGQPDRAREEALRSAHQLRKSGHAAAALRASLEYVYALHRAGAPGECIAAANLLAAELRGTSEQWTATQTHTELAVCLSYSDRLSEAGVAISAAITRAREHHLPALELRARTMQTNFFRDAAHTDLGWRKAGADVADFWSRPHPPNTGQQLYFNLSDLAGIEGEPYAAYAFGRTAAGLISQTPEVMLAAVSWDSAASLAAQAGLDQEKTQCQTEARRYFERAPRSRLTRIYETNAALYRAEALVNQGSYGTAAAQLRDLRPDDLLTDAAIVQRLHLLSLALWRANRFDEAGSTATELLARTRSMLSAIRSPSEKLGAALRLDSARRVLAELRLANAADSFQIWQDLQSPGTPVRVAGSPAGELYIAFAELPGGLTAWTVKDGTVRCHRYALHVRDLEAAIASLARACAERGDPRAIDGEADRLRRALFDPLLPLLAGVRTVAVEADGELGRVPFQLLLPEDYAVVRPFSFAGFREAKGGPLTGVRRAVVVNSPAPPDELRSEYPDLPQAGEEAREVAARFPGAVTIGGTAATSSAIGALAPAANLFHFSGHGTFAKGRGALIVAAEHSDPYSALLSGDAVLRQDWRRCRLAVLSACSTGVAGLQEPEGLARAFFSAGARSVVASLWNVDAAATRILMGEFYRAFTSGLAPADALRHASAVVRHSSGMRHPYYWAGFQVFGS